MPGRPNVAGVCTALVLAMFSAMPVPPPVVGPLTMLHIAVSVAPGGRPSSWTTPGSVIVTGVPGHCSVNVPPVDTAGP